MVKRATVPTKYTSPGYVVWTFARTIREAENVSRWNPWLAHAWMEEAKNMLSLDLPFFSEYDRCTDRINRYWSRMPMFRWYDEQTFWAKDGIHYPPTYLTHI
jgi:hypothetical protein